MINWFVMSVLSHDLSERKPELAFSCTFSSHQGRELLHHLLALLKLLDEAVDNADIHTRAPGDPVFAAGI